MFASTKNLKQKLLCVQMPRADTVYIYGVGELVCALNLFCKIFKN